MLTLRRHADTERRLLVTEFLLGLGERLYSRVVTQLVYVCTPGNPTGAV